MIRLAIASNPAFALDLSDAGEDATGYTADLIPRIRARYPSDELYFIVGGDSLVRSRWNRLDEVLEGISAFLVAPRNEISNADLDYALGDLSEEQRAKVRSIDLPRVGESATLVRERIESAQSVRYLVPEPVWRYIVEHELYRSPAHVGG